MTAFWKKSHFRKKNCMFWSCETAWKLPKYGIFSGPYFPAFGLNMERYRVCTSTPRTFTWDASLISLVPILKISFEWSCFLLSIIMAWIFPVFTLILFSLNQFKATSDSDSKDPIISAIVLVKQARVLSSVKLCAVTNKMK